jgi:hypothetical protein
MVKRRCLMSMARHLISLFLTILLLLLVFLGCVKERIDYNEQVKLWKSLQPGIDTLIAGSLTVKFSDNHAVESLVYVNLKNLNTGENHVLYYRGLEEFRTYLFREFYASVLPGKYQLWVDSANVSKLIVEFNALSGRIINIGLITISLGTRSQTTPDLSNRYIKSWPIGIQRERSIDPLKYIPHPIIDEYNDRIENL